MLSTAGYSLSQRKESHVDLSVTFDVGSSYFFDQATSISRKMGTKKRLEH